MADIILDKSTTALLIADFYADMMTSLSHAVDRGVVAKTQAVQQAARDAGLLVCYSATVFRPGYPEISDRNKTFSQRKASGAPAVSDPIQVIHEGVRPIEGEIVVGKHRVNALYGTDLDISLRANIEARDHRNARLRHQRSRTLHHPLRSRLRLPPVYRRGLLLRFRPGSPRLPHPAHLPPPGRRGPVRGRD